MAPCAMYNFFNCILDENNCERATVGSSEDNSKTITLNGDGICPHHVDKTNRIQIERYFYAARDTWSISQQGRRVTATRSDKPNGWDLHLQFDCCNSGTEKYLKKRSLMSWAIFFEILSFK